MILLFCAASLWTGRRDFSARQAAAPFHPARKPEFGISKPASSILLTCNCLQVTNAVLLVYLSASFGDKPFAAL